MRYSVGIRRESVFFVFVRSSSEVLRNAGSRQLRGDTRGEGGRRNAEVLKLCASFDRFFNVSTTSRGHGHGCSSETSSLERSIVFQWQDYQLCGMPGCAFCTVSACFFSIPSIVVVVEFFVRVLGFCTYSGAIDLQARRAALREGDERASPFRFQWFE